MIYKFIMLIIGFTILSTNCLGKDSLIIKLDDHAEVEIDLSESNSKYQSRRKKIVVDNHPNYKKRITYIGLDFNELIEELGRALTPEDVVKVTCVDGYTPVLDGKYFADKKALLAYKEAYPAGRISRDKRWTKVKMGNEYVNPGPYFLVWPSQQNHKHSWPYQIKKISILKKSKFKTFTKITPSEEYSLKGFEIFKSKCIKCHSIKYIGAKGKAPDLAYILGYRTKDYIKNRIRNGRGKMPAFSSKKISDEGIKYLIRYFDSIYKTMK